MVLDTYLFLSILIISSNLPFFQNLSTPLLFSATTVILYVEKSVNNSISETYLRGIFMKYDV